MYDIIIVGAGVAGSAMAYALGNDGRSVLLIERDWKEPDRIVGELLQPGGVEALKQLGLESVIEGIDGIPVHGYAVFTQKESVQLPYNQKDTQFIGKSFHHGRLISNLRKAAKSADNVTTLEGTVSELLKKDEKVVGVRVGTSEYFAALTIVADGCFSKFRKQIITKQPIVKSHFCGLVLQDCNLPFPNHGHVILANPSPILLYQIGTRDTRILVDIPGKLPSVSDGALNAYLETMVGPQLPESVQDSFYKALKTQKIRSMPNSWLPQSSGRQPGVFLLGDSGNMRHPLTGGGMTVAFWDVLHVRNALRPLKTLENADSALKKLYWSRKPLSSVINILAQALYDLFSAGDNPHMIQLQKACFGYFKLGGQCVSVPVGLLAGLIQSPFTLVVHFFAVALYGMWLMCTEKPLYLLPVSLMQSLLVLLTAFKVIAPVILSEVIS